MHTKITDQVVRAAMTPKAGQLFIRDKALKGFAVRVLASGVRSFVFEAKVNGRFARHTLGQYPVMTVPVARQEALELRGKVAAARRSGTDPFAKPAPAVTFGHLADRYITEHSKIAKKSWRRDERRLGLHFGRWRGRRLTDITDSEVAGIHQAIAAERGQVEANRAIELARAVFNKALKWKLLKGDNPAAGITRYPEEARDRFLEPVEIHAVIRALAHENIYWRTFFMASLVLGARKNELLGTRWADINFNQRQIQFPAKSTKSKRPHLLPLPAPLVDVLASLPSRTASPWVFPGTGHTGHLTEPKKAWARIRQRAGVADATIHDLRRSLGSLLAAQGADMLLIGKVLNHKSPSATAVYARFGNAPLRLALEGTAAIILGGDDARTES